MYLFGEYVGYGTLCVFLSFVCIVLFYLGQLARNKVSLLINKNIFAL